ncbi:MAG: ATP-binding cassette domain-containing protein, partial [Burkholderiales bacterium]
MGAKTGQHGMPLLEVRGLETAYGVSQVLFGIHLTVERGEVVALLGRNGAGKTTTLASIMGVVPPRRGSIRFKDREVLGLEPFLASQLGLGYVPENSRLFTSLTIAENFEAARLPPRTGSSAAAWTIERVVALFPDLGTMLERR